MDTTLVAVPRVARRPSPLVIAAIAAALAIGAAAGGTIARATAEDPAPATASWDAQKLLAYQQRLRFAPTVDAQPTWDAAKVEAFEGRLAAG